MKTIYPKEIFRAYDIRGIYPSEINEQFAYDLGRAFAVFLKEKVKAESHGRAEMPTVLVNRDLRASSEALHASLTLGLAESGVNVFDGGIATTPMHYFGIGTYEVHGGIMVTASHGAPEMNGFKISTKKERISQETGLLNIWELMNNAFPQNSRLGVIQEFLYEDRYVNFLKTFWHTRHFSKTMRVILDASGGPTARILEKLLPSLSIQPEKIFFEPDPKFEKHSPNPLLPKSQEFIQKTCRKTHCDLGVLFDGDGDRAVFFDEEGAPIPGDFIAALIAETKLERKKYGTVLLDVAASRRVREFIEEKNGVAKIMRVGTSYFRNALEKDGSVIIGAESSGHFYYPEFFNSDAAILTFLYILDILLQKETALSELLRPLNTLARSGEINFSVRDKEEVLKRMEENFSDGIISKIDGITVEYPEWWFNIRPSNTENLIRLHIEANTKDLLDEKKVLLEGLIKRE